MFPVISPAVKNLLSQSNEWKALQTYTKLNLGTSTTPINKFKNTSAALTGAQQVSPSTEWEGQGFKTDSGGASQSVKFNMWALPVQGISNPTGVFKLQKSINNAAYSDLLDLNTTNPDGNNDPLMKFWGVQELSFSQSNQDPNTSKALQLTNVSGQYTNLNWKFGSTVKSALTVDSNGSVTFKTISGQSYFWNFGGSVGSSSLIMQLYSGGLYVNGGGFFQGKVTAGQASTTPPAYLNTFGSFAGRGTLITDPTYTITENDFVIYGDASNAFLCTGTPSVTACSTYTGAGQATCESHLPCTWSNGNPCSEYNGNQGSCTATSGCTWDESPCSGANNTDQTSCESQDDAYGGNCSWDTSTCPSQTSQGACEAITGCTWNDTCSGYGDQSNCEANSCTWNFTDCVTSFFDETSCNAQAGCSWDGVLCNGQFNTSCVGGNCSGNLCNGNYNTGNCSGTYGVGCFGTVSCASYLSSGPCSGEAGCSPATGSTWTLPVSSQASLGNVSRFHYLKNIGPSGTINVNAGSGDTLESSIALTAGQAALVHFYSRTSNCSEFVTEGTCTPSGCSWNPAVVCSSFVDQSTCESSGCTWDGSSCSGAGSAANCSGQYISSKKWYKHATIPA